MVFVPMVAHQAKPPSARALDLARRLKEQIDLFERQYPGTSREDLRAAAAIAIGEESAAVPARRRAIAAALGMTAAIGAVTLILAQGAREGGGTTAWPMVATAIAIAAAGAVVAVVRRSRQ